MAEKVTRISEITISEDYHVTIVGDLYVKGDLKDETLTLESLEVTGHLWVDGKLELEYCNIIAKSITILGGCSAEEVKSTEGNVFIAGEYICIDTIISAQNIVLDGKDEIADKKTKNRYTKILNFLEAKGDITVNNCYCSDMEAEGDITVLSSLCAVEDDEDSYIKAKNIYGKKVIINEMIAEDCIYLEEMPEAHSSDKAFPIMDAEVVVIEEN